MSAQESLLDFDSIAARHGVTRDTLDSLAALAHSARQPEAQRTTVFENGQPRLYLVERHGAGPIVTAYGTFWMFVFSIDDQWEKYSVIVRAGFDEATLRPVFRNPAKLLLRIDSGCETGQVFGDLTCECADQLKLSMEAIHRAGEGIIVHIPFQDGRGMGLPFKLATLWLQDALGLNTVESASIVAPDGVIDLRTYSGVIAILRYLGVPQSCEITLATNNPAKLNAFRENGFRLSDKLTPLIAEASERTHANLVAKREFLGHQLPDEYIS